MRPAALVVLLCVASAAHAEGPPLTLESCLARVGQSNRGLAAERANVPIAEAQTVIAKAFPDPTLTAGLASLDVSGVGAQNNYTASVGVPIEWPVKRPARLALASANVNLVNAELEDFVRLLRGTAATAWVDAVFSERVLGRRRQAAASLAELARLNEERQREGAASEVVVLQSRLEARRAQGDVLIAEGDAAAARVALQELMGLADALPPLEGELRFAPREFALQESIDTALAVRPDLRARQRALDVAASQLRLAQANRGVDFTVSLGWLGYTPGVQGSAFQAPPYQTVSALLSAPLPFSRVFDGELRAASAAQQQTLAQQDATKLKVTLEVRAALSRYQASAARLAQFDESLLGDSDRMLEMARYAFAQGSSRLTDLLSAQRTWTETYLAWEAALADHARALVALETAVGTWDL